MLSSTLAAVEKNQWIDRGWYVVTEFERTPSINFQRALDLAKVHPGFTPLMDERNVLIYRNIYRESDLLEFQQMAALIKNWKGTKFYVKGDRIDFDMLGSGIQCYIRTVITRKDALHSPESCQRFEKGTFDMFGCLGCHRSHISMEWKMSQVSQFSVWFEFGSLDHNRVYHIHKEELEGAAIGELIEYRYCPLLDLDHIRELIRQLPERIDPRKDREWRYHRTRKTGSVTPRLSGRATREPEILPVSEDAYRAYLKRKIFL